MRARDRRDALTELRDIVPPELDAVTPPAAALGALDPKLEASPGLGAWTFYYKFGWKPAGDRQIAGLLAMKRALIDNGFGRGIDLEQLIFGNAVTNRTKEFQTYHALGSDGVIGPRTARRLFLHYFDIVEAGLGIPDHLLARIGCGESNDDPIAEGVIDAEDEGILQFHMPFWPGVTLEQAWDPREAIRLAGTKLSELRLITRSWQGAVAAWNIGATYAKQWVAAGYPASGGPIMGTDADGNKIDSFERATHYWNYVTALPYQ